MSSATFSKSKAFKEREQKIKENLRETTKQELVADLSRLFGDTTFSDVLFTVGKTDFPAHAAILRARAPKFSQRFLPAYASTDAIHTCVQINGLEPSEFETFLRVAYTEDYFKDYDKSSYPWTKQEPSSSATKSNGIESEIDAGNHVQLCTNAKGNDSSMQSTKLEGQNSCETEAEYNIHCKNHECTTLAAVKREVSVDEPGECSNGNYSELRRCEETCSHTVESKLVATGQAGRLFPVQNGDSSNNPVMHNGNTQNSEHSAADNLSMDNVDHNTHCQRKLDVKACKGSETINSPIGCNHVSDDKALSSQNSDTSNDVPTEVRPNEPVVNTETAVASEKQEELSATAFITNDNEYYTSIEMGRSSMDETSACLLSGTECNQSDALRNCSETGCKTARRMSEDEFLESCCKLGQDLLKLQRDGTGSDVTFLVGNKKVRAHRAVLCARSNYFSAMLHGGWIEGASNEIPLIGVNYNGLMVVMNYIYGGTSQITSNMATICDTLPLVDMYGLEGFKEVIISNLRIEKCHLFHKPCSECQTGVFECLELSQLFSLTDLKKLCIKWVAKYFERVLCSKEFAFLSKSLQDEILAEIESNISVSSAVEVLNHCDRLFACTPQVKWTEPVHSAVSTIQEACLLFVTNNLLRLVGEKSFQEILKGVGWSIPFLEKIFSAVQGNLTVETCCSQLQAVLRLRGFVKDMAREEELGNKTEDSYPEEVVNMVYRLHARCLEFMRSNLFKVTRSSGWKRLSPRTQREVREGAMFVGLGETENHSVTDGALASHRSFAGRPSANNRSFAGRLTANNRSSAGASATNRSTSAQTSRRPPLSTQPALQAIGTGSRTVGRGRGRTAFAGPVNNSSASARPSSARSKQGSSHVGPVCMRPARGRAVSAQNCVGHGKPAGISSGKSSKKPISTKASTSNNLESSSKRPSSDKIPPSSNIDSSSKRPSSAKISSSNDAHSSNKPPGSAAVSSSNNVDNSRSSLVKRRSSSSAKAPPINQASGRQAGNVPQVKGPTMTSRSGQNINSSARRNSDGKPLPNRNSDGPPLAPKGRGRGRSLGNSREKPSCGRSGKPQLSSKLNPSSQGSYKSHVGSRPSSIARDSSEEESSSFKDTNSKTSCEHSDERTENQSSTTNTSPNSADLPEAGSSTGAYSHIPRDHVDEGTQNRSSTAGSSPNSTDPPEVDPTTDVDLHISREHADERTQNRSSTAGASPNSTDPPEVDPTTDVDLHISREHADEGTQNRSFITSASPISAELPEAGPSTDADSHISPELAEERTQDQSSATNSNFDSSDQENSSNEQGSIIDDKSQGQEMENELSTNDVEDAPSKADEEETVFYLA